MERIGAIFSSHNLREVMSVQAGEFLHLVEKRLDQLIPEREGPHALLFQAARFSLLSRAKRLRPLIVLSILSDCQQPLSLGIDPACALEMVHTYSLIHDDLPSMDDSSLRRGRPTLHKVYGEGIAILTGDFLLTQAFSILAQSPELSPTMKNELVLLLSQHAGGEGMVGGQVADLLSVNQTIDRERLRFIHQKKTAALFAASFEFGARLGNLPLSQREQLRAGGMTFGLAFQLLDDLLDEGSADHPLMGEDAKNDKMTARTLYTARAAIDTVDLLFAHTYRCTHGLALLTRLVEEYAKAIPQRPRDFSQ